MEFIAVFVLVWLFGAWLFWQFLKAIRWIFRSLLGSSRRNDSEKISTPRKKTIVNHDLSKLKYNNPVYESFVRKAYKAFEAYQAAGDNVKWYAENDGFSLTRKMSSFMGYETFKVFIFRDDNNRLKLTDPYCMCITYSFTIGKDDLNYYRGFCEYINNYYRTHNMLNEELFYTHNVFTVKYAECGEYCCNMHLMDHNSFEKQTKECGEPAVFDFLFDTTKNKYIGGLELYKNRHK